MSYQELIAALRKEADETVEELWREARAEAARAGEEQAAVLERLRRESLARRSAAAGESAREVLGEAEREAQRVRLAALRDLSERLAALGGALLDRVREERDEGLLEALVRELPPHVWETVRVNPANAQAARRLFPGAEVVPDPAIRGGLRVGGDGGRIRVDNTLEKRLARGWPELLPRLIASARREAKPDDVAGDR